MPTQQLQLPLPGEFVKMSNAIARAQWQPDSIWEPRIVALVASKVQESDQDFQTYKIPVSELTGVSDENLRGNQYRDIAKSIEHLGKATIRIKGNKPRNFRQYPIFAMCGYEDGNLIAGFHPDLKPHFLALKEQFTVYSLFEFLMLPSTYSQRIFEILKSWGNSPEVIIPVAELHEMLCTPESLRANFKDFRRRVLEKAHKDILERTSLRFDWEAIKNTRGVTAIRFVFQEDDPVIPRPDESVLDLFQLPVENTKQKQQGKSRNKTALRAMECAKSKQGDCLSKDNRPAVCRTCEALSFCSELRDSESLRKPEAGNQI